MMESTPMMDQYSRIKKHHRGEILFFRLGDFYEMFAEDAVEVSGLLNLTLTSRNGQAMCGVPHHAARTYISRLLKAGKKVAICEQFASGGSSRGLFERKVVEVITPGTTVEDDYLETGEANYLAALAQQQHYLSFAYIDVSTGSFFATAFPQDNLVFHLRKELERIHIRELIIQESLLEESKAIAGVLADRSGLIINRWSDWLFDMERSTERLSSQFKTINLKAFGLDNDSPEIMAAGAVLEYLGETAQSLLPHINKIQLYKEAEFVSIDESSQRNLELVKNMHDGTKRFSLLEVLDHTKTSMGLRLLKWRILHPLRQLTAIENRHEIVDRLYRHQEVMSNLRNLLSRILDLERLSSRIAMDKANAKDLAAIRNSLAAYQTIIIQMDTLDLIERVAADMALDSWREGSQRLIDLQELLERAITDNPSTGLSEGGIIKDGYNSELDQYRNLRDNGHRLLEDYVQEERQATGIQSLKVKYNRIIGYFFEVTKSNLSIVPPYFIRRQAISSGERYTTERLTKLENDIITAADSIIELERELFFELRDGVKRLLSDLFTAARIIAGLDLCQSMARAATLNAWTKPTVNDEKQILIQEGRHPVVEAHLSPGSFVPNDVMVNGDNNSFILITGPNMAGKSTYLRQTALISIMAQIGSFVPGSDVCIGLVDKIFCRVGAQDNVARGESTFLVEMNETAYILRTASDQSLVIMDEVGRGTGTHDGLSLAWAICEELLRMGCRVLFATHFHELSQLKHPRLVNRSMDVVEKNGEVVFLKRIREGATAESFGIHVAKLAGLPDHVIDRAYSFLQNIRVSQPNQSFSDSPDIFNQKTFSSPDPLGQMLIDQLSKLNPDSITPIEALEILDNWKKTLIQPGGTLPHHGRKARQISKETDQLSGQLLFPE